MEGSCANRLHLRTDDAKPALRHFPDPSALCMKQKTWSLQSMPKMADDADVVWRILESALLANIGKRSVDPDHDHSTTTGSGISPPGRRSKLRCERLRMTIYFPGINIYNWILKSATANHITNIGHTKLTFV